MLNVFIIDFFGSEVFDDVLIIEKFENGLCRVGVYIVDVFYFVRRGSGIDFEVKKRGIFYFFGYSYGDVLMFLKELSYYFCSLLLNEEWFVVFFYLDLN